MNILVLSTGGDGFPTGGAYTNRLLSLSKGLVNNGCRVTILILYPGKNNIAQKKGTIDGIKFRFTGGTVRPVSVTGRKITGIKGIINSIGPVLHMHKKDNFDVILSFTASFSQNFSFYLISRMLRVPFIREKNEYPKAILLKGFENLTRFDRVFLKNAYKIYDGFILISDSLRSFFMDKSRKNAPIEIVPIVVDIDRFEEASHQIPDNYITYCGYLFGEKDGISILLQSFAAISKKYPDWKLMLVGDTSDQSGLQKLSSEISRLKMQNKVELTGFVNRDEVPRYLSKSSVLVLARPNNVQAQGGFPTKLGEYLATGRPVLVTATSDIPKYIKDGVNGFLARPGNIENFSEKLDQILGNYPMASDIGLKGKELALNDFNGDYQGRRIIAFINKVLERKK